jgi:Trp operon repressor
MNERVGGTDEKLTTLTGNVIAAVSAQVRHLVDVGLVEPDKLRLTIEARQEKAKALVEGGLSQRKAAEHLGVSVGTVNSDLGVQKLNEKRSEVERTSDRDERREAALAEPPVAPEALWLWGRLNDFWRDGMLKREPADVMSTMTKMMRTETLMLAPLVTQWLGRFGGTDDGSESDPSAA